MVLEEDMSGKEFEGDLVRAARAEEMVTVKIMGPEQSRPGAVL